MAKHSVKEDTLYYKSMRLNSNALIVEVKEKSLYGQEIDPAIVKIYHSPAKWDGDRFSVNLKDRQELKDYIAMLVDFEQRFGDLLEQVQKPEELIKHG